MNTTVDSRHLTNHQQKTKITELFTFIIIKQTDVCINNKYLLKERRYANFKLYLWLEPEINIIPAFLYK